MITGFGPPHRSAAGKAEVQREEPVIVVVMSVSCSGKATIAARLAAHLAWEYDCFHPEVNVEKMHSGKPLTDDDRWHTPRLSRDARPDGQPPEPARRLPDTLAPVVRTARDGDRETRIPAAAKHRHGAAPTASCLTSQARRARDSLKFKPLSVSKTLTTDSCRHPFGSRTAWASWCSMKSGPTPSTSSRIVRATARKPCLLISSLPMPMRRIAARMALSLIGRPLLRALG
jgi:hypothetical protein